MGIWTTVKNTPADTPITFETESGQKINHADLVNTIDEARQGYWYWTALSAPEGHSQTMKGSQSHDGVDQVYYGRRFMFTDDGAQVSLDYALDKPDLKQWDEDVKYAPQEGLPRYPVRTRYLKPAETAARDNPKETRPLVIHLHGLTGGSHESYVRSTIVAIREHNDVENVVLTARGCNRSPIISPQLSCPLWTNDLRYYLSLVKSTQPNRRIYAVGYSLGAAVLANYLGQESEASPLSGACVVSAPWDLYVNHLTLHNSIIGNNIYEPAMAANLNRLIRNNQKVLDQNAFFKERIHAGPPPKSMWEFHDRYTAPFLGFDSVFDYYRCASPVHRLRNIRTPCLILAAEDDPVCGDTVVPYLDASRNPYTHVVSTTTGGHLGWFPLKGQRWHSKVVAKYILAMESVDTRKVHAEFNYPARRFFNGSRLVY
ncbi:hypothetical protein B9G98_03902 [Wickerhamiella sorbophila]|uniref:AB hydrolase-1 domain-containing protein n=1 Tax=Wickerhamiella sorbophila TaxID=45607 RepID=A0A2T0FMR2_9ASCO|nr:hypothetical protein B9G98_03902 [Wickerhamiella sorbophila]PRT56282.1 hypothetical protein B9G98_03902 [Wickerhamiella sorbophila]